MSLIYDVDFNSQTRVLSLLDKAGNVISSCEVPSKDVDDPNKPLMLRATEDNSSVSLQRYGNLSNKYKTSKDGITWNNYGIGTLIELNKGDVVYFRCSDHPTTQESTKYVQFHMTGKIEAWHNAYSMISSSFTGTWRNVGQFGMCSLFSQCKSLTKAPLLLNALSYNCYEDMFFRCTSLTKAPKLPATTLADSCYESMFYGCTSLTEAPELPAITLEHSCYKEMFYGCTSLTKTPELPATTLDYYCYYSMFSGCQSLKEVRIAATKTATNALYNWLSGVSATGDFYCDPNATIFPADSASGIPQNWTRRNIADYPVTP